MKNKLRSFIAFLVLFVAASLFAKPASALPAWCFQYTSQDSIEGSGAANWWSWGSSNTGVVVIGPTSASHWGTSAIRMSFATSEPTGSFLIADRLFDYTTMIDTSLNVRHNRFGCDPVMPTNPPAPSVKPLRFCSASIWVLPSGGKGSNGSLTLLTPDYFIVATANFNFPNSSSGTWQKVSIASTEACQSYMVARVGINRTSTSIAAVFDDLEVIWDY